MRKTIKKVMTVVPVLITSCQVSLNWNTGPVTSQTRITPTASMKVAGLPVTRAVAFAKRVNCERDFVGRIDLLSVEGQTRARAMTNLQRTWEVTGTKDSGYAAMTARPWMRLPCRPARSIHAGRVHPGFAESIRTEVVGWHGTRVPGRQAHIMALHPADAAR